MSEIISTVILVFTAVFAFFCGLKGFFSGAIKQGIRFGTLVLAIGVSVLVTSGVYSYITSQLSGLTAQQIVDTINSYAPVFEGDSLGWISGVEADVLLYILAVPFGIIILPIAFIPVFLIINIISMIVSAIICKATGINKMKKNVGIRFGGMAIGVVQGIVIAAMILLPVAGLSPYIEEAMDTVEVNADTDEASRELSDSYNEYVAPVTEGVSVKLLSFFGGSIVYDLVATVDVGDESVSMTSLIPDAATIYSESMKCSGMDWKHLTSDQEQSVRTMVTTFKNNEYLTAVSAEIISTFSGAIASGEVTFELDESLDSIIKEFFEVFSETTSVTVGADIDTLVDVYLVLASDGFFTAMASDESSDEMLAILTSEEDGKTIVNKVVEILRANERTKNLVTLITKLSITIMSNSMELGEEVTQVYENVKTGINDVLSIEKEGKTEDEYLDELSASLDGTLRENGIEIEKDIVDDMAGFINENFEAGVTLTDEEIDDIILSYYDAYIKYLANGTDADSGSGAESGSGDVSVENSSGKSDGV